MTQLAVEEEVQKKSRVVQHVFEAKWHIGVDDKEEIVSQLICGKDLHQASVKAAKYGKQNVAGMLVSLTLRKDILI